MSYGHTEYNYLNRSDLSALEEKLAIEQQKEQSWRDEYKEISGTTIGSMMPTGVVFLSIFYDASVYYKVVWGIQEGGEWLQC